MTGFSNYSADNYLNHVTGQIPAPSLPSVFLALFVAVGTDAGTGFTEVTGGSYARVQVAGAISAGAAFTTASPNITMGSSNPGWVTAGMSVYDTTTGQAVGSVSTFIGTALVLTANAAHASSGAGDSLTFSAFGNASGTAPSSVTNVAAISLAQATASWGSAIAFGLYDALTGGDLLEWDFLGNYQWLPFEMASGGNLASVKANGYLSNDPIVFTSEYGGTLPTLSAGTMTGYTINYVATPATDTINVDTVSGPSMPIVTTTSGSGMVRKILAQLIPVNVTFTFPAGALTLTLA
jgi:hypothetical protein